MNKHYHLNITGILLFCVYFFFVNTQPIFGNTSGGLDRLIGKNDAVAIANSKGNILFSKNADKKLIPASTLKILTALVALHYLGADYQFKTEFYMDRQSNLKVKGYGDPLLVSETLITIAKQLGSKLNTVENIVLDDSYFKQPLTIPGVTASSEPYDAPNGALCANFNTVYFKRTQKGTYQSAEPQTPLLPFAINKIKASRISQGRIVLTHKKKEATLYTGHLLAYFLSQVGVNCAGKIQTGTIDVSQDRLIYTYTSEQTVEQLIAELLEYSNNFIANQLLIASGAVAYGSPGTLEKGVQAVRAYTQYELNCEDIEVIEGSGISRSNRVSAKNMMRILLKFKPYATLMRHEHNEYYKTGTLKGIRTRVGYIQTETNELYPFVVLLNTPGKTTHSIMRYLIHEIAK